MLDVATLAAGGGGGDGLWLVDLGLWSRLCPGCEERVQAEGGVDRVVEGHPIRQEGQLDQVRMVLRQERSQRRWLVHPSLLGEL